MRHKKGAPNSTQVVHLLEMPNGGASDLALKKEVAEIASALERILALRPVTWRWRESLRSKNLQHGFIAQDIEAIFPEIVSVKKRSDGTTYKYLSSKALLPYLVKALAEQQHQIDTMKHQLDILKDK